jgi:hypothetical protein
MIAMLSAKPAKRMRDRKPPQPDAPEPQSGLDPARIETWQLEHDVCEHRELPLEKDEDVSQE